MLSSHRRLLATHWLRMVRLTRLAKRIGETEPPSFVVGELGGQFAEVCMDAGEEFLDVIDDEGRGAFVVPLDAPGLITILADLFPEGVEPTVMRPPSTVAVFVVDADDVPALAILGVEKFTLEPGRA